MTGLDEGNYEFKETKAPTGYSVNSENKAFTITANEEKEVTEDAGEFVNTKLSALPETGGIGTTIFTIVGCGIMIAAAGLFFASRRKVINKSFGEFRGVTRPGIYQIKGIFSETF